MRGKKAKINNMYYKIRQLTYKKLVEQMELDKKTIGTPQWDDCIHQKRANQREKIKGINALNYTWLYVEYIMDIIDNEWKTKHKLYRNHNQWHEQNLLLHKLKIKRMIVLEMVAYLQAIKEKFLESLPDV